MSYVKQPTATCCRSFAQVSDFLPPGRKLGFEIQPPHLEAGNPRRPKQHRKSTNWVIVKNYLLEASSGFLFFVFFFNISNIKFLGPELTII